jgi:hypothetical protein
LRDFFLAQAVLVFVDGGDLGLLVTGLPVKLGEGAFCGEDGLKLLHKSGAGVVAAKDVYEEGRKGQVSCTQTRGKTLQSGLSNRC